MSKFRNVSGEPLFVPAVRRVIEPDEVFDFPADVAAGLNHQTDTWAAESAPVKKKES